MSQSNTKAKIFLKSRRDGAVRRFHPWVFSGAINRKEGGVSDGDTVDVFDNKGNFLATGHYHQGSIMVRLFTYEQQENINTAFWKNKLEKAVEVRRSLDLVDNSSTDCFRLVHGEGDGMPGLVIDIYGKTAVIQCHSIGMHREREKIATALQEVFQDSLTAIYDKSVESLPPNYGADFENGYLLGNYSEYAVSENGHQFLVNWETGQKTGFFLDQRVNRQYLTHFCKGKTVLNAFCYSGGFSVYALSAGATMVHSVDISQKAIDLTDANIAINNLPVNQHQSYTTDVLKFLQSTTTNYEVMVVDPPAYAKTIKKRHNAVQGYKRLNAVALSKIAPGGILFSFSCSQVVDKALFYNTIVAAAIEARRNVRVLAHLSQPGDHPVSLFHPEGSYLKGLVLYVE